MKPYQQQFKQHIQRAEERIFQKIEQNKKELQWQRYALTLANIQALMPEVMEGRNSQDVLFELLAGRSQAPAESYFPSRIFDYKFEGAFIDVVRDRQQPRIFCTYHLGSYRAILGALIRLGHDFSLVIDQNVFDNQGEPIQQAVRNIKAAYNSDTEFELINAEAFDSAMQMARQLRQGRSLVVYLDGNTGTGGVFRHDAKLLKISFFQAQLFARQGIAYLSYITQTPIVPVIAFRELDIDVVLRFYEPLLPESGQSKKDYCKSSIQMLYHILEENLRRYPLQWEGWLYVHKYLDLDDLAPKLLKTHDPAALPSPEASAKLVFNQRRFSLFRHGASFFLFDSATFLTYEIGESEFTILRSFHPEFSEAAGMEVDVESDTIEELLERQVLTYCAN